MFAHPACSTTSLFQCLDPVALTGLIVHLDSIPPLLSRTPFGSSFLRSPLFPGSPRGVPSTSRLPSFHGASGTVVYWRADDNSHRSIEVGSLVTNKPTTYQRPPGRFFFFLRPLQSIQESKWAVDSARVGQSGVRGMAAEQDGGRRGANEVPKSRRIGVVASYGNVGD